MDLLASVTANLILYTLLIVSLNNFIVGKTSIWPVGHIAFFGIGALATGIIMADYLLSGWLAILSSLFIGLILSFLIGLTTLRLAEDYFILLSISICEITRAASINIKGPGGINGISRPTLLGLSLENDWMFIASVLLPIFLVTVILAFRFSYSPLERVCILVRQNETAAKLLRIPTLYYKIGCFCIGSTMAAVVGGLYTIYSRSTDPSIITINQSILLFAMVLLGGINSIRGSIVGGLMLVAVPRILEYFINSPASSYYAAQIIQLAYGILLILIIRFMPQGIMGSSKNWFYNAEGR
jgi:branched-chain amino acid transport system permease protein